MANAQIVFKLTLEQQELLKPLYDQAHDAALAGEPGMIVAQCDSKRNFRIGFVPFKKAKRLVAMMGNTLDDRA